MRDWYHMWATAFSSHGIVPHQSPLVAQACSVGGAEIIFAGGLGGCYTLNGDVAVSTLDGAGLLPLCNQMDVLGHIKKVKSVTGASAVAFPLVYRDASTSSELDKLCGSLSLERRPSMLINWSDNGQSLPQRRKKRIGSRAVRRQKRFEKANFLIRNICGKNAARIMVEVERKSWKRALQQDMETRRQAPLYSELLLDACASLRVVFDRDIPIAYRLDYIVNKILYCLKWSFDESYRRFSPGYYLVAHDLYFSVDTEIEIVDLAGSPDHLKAVVATHERARSAFIWPNNTTSITYLSERCNFDRNSELNFLSGKGIRNLFCP